MPPGAPTCACAETWARLRRARHRADRRQPAAEGGLRVGTLWGNGKYEGAVFVRNLLNPVRAVGGIDFNNLTGFVNDPRTLGVQFRANF